MKSRISATCRNLTCTIPAFSTRLAMENRLTISKAQFARLSSTTTPRQRSRQEGGPSATAMFYRKLVPSMLHCLALGSIVYYALELVHSNLDRQFTVQRMQVEVKRLEHELEEAKLSSLSSEQAQEAPQVSRSGWRFWK